MNLKMEWMVKNFVLLMVEKRRENEMRSLFFYIAWYQEKKIGFFKSIYKGWWTAKELRDLEKSIVVLTRR